MSTVSDLHSTTITGAGRGDCAAFSAVDHTAMSTRGLLRAMLCALLLTHLRVGVAVVPVEVLDKALAYQFFGLGQQPIVEERTPHAPMLDAGFRERSGHRSSGNRERRG